jgi:hypothetical protein
MKACSVVLVAILAFLISALPGRAAGPSALVEKSGQTTPYGPRDDGDLQRGVSRPSLRFIDLGNGWVLDTLTKLQWLKNANCFGLVETWQEALDYVDDLNAGSVSCGQTKQDGGARLPNVKELQSLIDFGHSDPSLQPDHPFVGVESTWYWTSTTRNFNPAHAWVVDLFGGITAVETKVAGPENYYVWPVRGGVSPKPVK